MLKWWAEDIDSYFDRDPAMASRLEVILCYPGFHAVAIYRMTHWLWKRGFRLVARLLAHIARIFTGIEIHPAATIGTGLFIDHGHGVVIGETAVIGNKVTLYHDVTLGGTSLKEGVRHPHLEDGVIVGAGAQILGPIRIGKGARIGANAVVVRDVAAGDTVVGIPARVVNHTDISDDQLTFTAYGTPTDGAGSENNALALELLREQVEALQVRIEKLESGQKAA